MKKLFITAVVCALFTPAFAGIDQGIEQGMTHLSVLGGFAVPVNEYGSGNSKLDYGDIGVTYGAQVIHHLTKNFGLGVEANGTNYDKTDVTVLGNKVKSSADKYGFFVAGKHAHQQGHQPDREGLYERDTGRMADGVPILPGIPLHTV